MEALYQRRYGDVYIVRIKCVCVCVYDGCVYDGFGNGTVV